MNNLFFALLLLALCSCERRVKPGDKLIISTLADYQYYLNSRSDSSFVFVQKTDSILGSSGNELYVAVNNFVKGNYFHGQSNYPLALKFLKEAEAKLSSLKVYDSLLYSTKLSISNVYNNLGEFDDAIRYALNAKKGFENLNNLDGEFSANLSLARIYQYQGKIDKAKKYLKINSLAGNKNLQFKAMHLLANIYGEQGNIDSALALDNKVLAGAAGMADHQQSPFYNNKALCFNELKQYDSAILYFQKSLAIDSAENNPQNLAANYSDISEMYVGQQNYPLATIYANKSLDLGQKIGRKITEFQAYKILHKISRKTGDFRQAVAYGDSINALQKVLSNETLDRNIEELNLVYATAKREKIIQQQKGTIQLQNWLVGTTSAIILTTILLIFINSRKRKLQHTLDSIVRSQEEQKAIASAELKERQRISRDLHDNMGAYTTALIANVENLKAGKESSAELKKMKNNAEQILSSLRETIWVLNNKDISLLDFHDQFINYCQKILSNFEGIEIEAEESIGYNRLLSASVALQLNKILQEAFQNAVKHSEGTVISYRVSSTPTTIIFSIIDNGKGFANGESYNGNGLENMKWRADEIAALISIDSSAEGTSIIVKINKQE